MKYRVAVIGMLMTALGCGDPFGPGPQKPGPDFPVPKVPPGSISEDQMDMVGKGVDLRLFDTDPTTGIPRKPTVWIHADVFTVTDKDIWSFEKARAVIYGKNEGDDEIVLEAGEGRFQESKMAYLRGGVVGRVRNMRLDLTDIRWLNDENRAESDNPVSIVNGESKLNASSLRLYPREKQLLLTNVTGLIRLERNQP